jgi:four helix bundle suffix protein
MCMTKANKPLSQSNGNHEHLKVFQLSRVIFDITNLFSQRYINYLSRTRDQMVQAARSTCQNIAEGNIDGTTSACSGLHLLNVARGSLVELKCDYQDFLRQNKLPFWEKNDPRRIDCIRRRISTNEQFYDFIHTVVPDDGEPDKACAVANATLLLIFPTEQWLAKMLDNKMEKFIQEGGFKEKLYRLRKQQRDKNNGETD